MRDDDTLEINQRCDHYTDANHAVWKQLFERQITLMQRYACREYLDGLACLKISPERIASLESVNDSLASCCDWQLVPVSGFLAPRPFFRLLSLHKFPIRTEIRRADELDFAELPDIFHDLVGHGPHLFSPVFRSLLDAFGQAARLRDHDTEFLLRVTALFWTTFEVGLVRQDEELKAYGSALLSSHAEIANVFERRMPLRMLSAASFMSTEYQPRALQPYYAVINSSDDIYAALRELQQQAGAG